MKVKPWHFYLMLLALFTGLLAAWLYQTQATARAQEEISPNAKLIQNINELEEENTALEKELNSLRQEMENRQKSYAPGQQNLRSLEETLRRLEEQAGITQVAGPGIIITLDDNTAGARAAQEANPAFYQPEDFLIHDKNILYLVNELWAAGAEAIAVNDQRLAASGSDIRCVGPVILINSTRLSPLYEIKAIGKPEQLEHAITNGSEYPYLQAKEFPVKITRVDEMVIPPYKGAVTIKYAQPGAPRQGEGE